jgi:hypothetical protein
VSLSAYSPDQISAFWSGVSAVATAAAAAVAIATLLSIRTDSRDRSRPVVSAELLPLALSHGTSELVIQNVGSGVAKQVKVAFDPAISAEMGQTAGFIESRYVQTIPTMGPGRRLTNVYGHWAGDGSLAMTDPIPLDLTVSIEYVDTHGRRYNDRYDLSVMTLRNETRASPSNTDDLGLKIRYAKALEVIAQALDRP